MNATAALPIVGVDLAKSVFQLAVADGSWRVIDQQRLTRTQFERFFANRAVGLVVMEACGSNQVAVTTKRVRVARARQQDGGNQRDKRAGVHSTPH
jgi:transposase